MLFHIVDVFSETLYSGNQLAVVMGKPDDAAMQRIAREMNFSETTFVLSDIKKDGAYDVRIFTPSQEVPFAGHPVLGTAFVIATHLEKKQPVEIRLNLKGGCIPVGISYSNDGSISSLRMRQNPPEFIGGMDRQSVARALGVGVDSLISKLPVERVSTGLPFIIVPVRTLEAMRSIKLDIGAYNDLISDVESKAILAFCPETYAVDTSLNVRMFAPLYGIAEDPATGSGCGCLAAYLSRHAFFGSASVSARVEQGYEIGRKSILQIEADNVDGGIVVHVGGKVVQSAMGVLV